MDIQKLRISDINMIVHIRQTSGKLIQFKQRKDYGLTFVETGSVIFDHEGSTYKADPSHIVLMTKDIDYAISFESNCSFYVINFNLMDDLSGFNFYSFDVSVNKEITDFLSQLCIDWDFQHDNMPYSYISRVYQLLEIIAHSDNKTKKHSNAFSAIKPSIEYLKEHYTDPDISNDILAKVSNISTVYFRKLFSMQYGESPMNYIRQQRIEHAKLLLSSEYYSSISDVALDCGFNSLYHFSKTFKQLTGMSPTEYLAKKTDDTPEQ